MNAKITLVLPTAAAIMMVACLISDHRAFHNRSFTGPGDLRDAPRSASGARPAADPVQYKPFEQLANEKWLRDPDVKRAIEGIQAAGCVKKRRAGGTASARIAASPLK